MMKATVDAKRQEQRLEKILQQAVESPVYQTLFYRLLLDAQVYVLTDERTEELTYCSSQEYPIQFHQWQLPDKTPVIPFFSSLDTLKQAVIEQQVVFSTLTARELFTLSGGIQLLFNPKSEYGKLFYPEEVAMLLQTGAMSPVVEQPTEIGSEIWLGQPEVYPFEMVEALVALFTQRNKVRNAYLAMSRVIVQDDQPNLLVGLALDGTESDNSVLIQEAGSLASSAVLVEGVVDIYVISDDQHDVVSRYLTQHTQPFYQRRWGSWLRNAIPHRG